jgi:hypothetical protein
MEKPCGKELRVALGSKNWDQIRKYGPQSYIYKEMNSNNNLRDTGIDFKSEFFPVQASRYEWSLADTWTAALQDLNK